MSESTASWRRGYDIAAVGGHAVESLCVSDASASVRSSWQAAREAAVLALHTNVGVLVSTETRRQGHRVADAHVRELLGHVVVASAA